MDDIALSIPGGPAVLVSSKVHAALRSWPDLNLDRLACVAGELFACRKSTGQPHRQSLRDLVALVSVPENPRPAVVAQVLQVATVGAATPPAPAFGVVPPADMPRQAEGARQPLHCQRDRVVYVPLLGLPEYAVLSMRDYYAMREAGLHTRAFSVERERVTSKRTRAAHVVTGHHGTEDRAVRIAELLCGGTGPVHYVDSNPARLLRQNLRLDAPA